MFNLLYRRVFQTLVISLFLVSHGISQEMTRDQLLAQTSEALGLQVLDTAKTLKYDLNIRAGDRKQELSVITKGKRKLAASSMNAERPVVYVRNGANYFMKVNGRAIDLSGTDARKTLNGYNYMRGLSNLLKISGDMELLGAKDINGTEYWHLKAVEDRVTTHLYIDQVSFLPFRKRVVRRNNSGQVSRINVITFSEFITKDGVTLPGKQRIKREQGGQTVIEVLTLSGLEVGVDADNELFKIG